MIIRFLTGNILFILLISVAEAQIERTESTRFFTARQSGNLPTNYYQSANGLTCNTLKTALSAIIANGYNELQYLDLWATYIRTDKRRNDANTTDIVWDMYSDNPVGPEPYTFSFGIDQCGQYSKEGDCYNREHTFPQSWFDELPPMKSDMNHIFPTDGQVNGVRSNFPFGEVSNISITTRNGSKLGTGNNFGYAGTVFEPINEYKGDIARAILYMAVRYENQISSWQNNGNADVVLNGTSYPVFDPWHIRLLYKWHTQDPVSDKEMRRNDSVFVIQKNRNPFIDRPEWVYDIWNCTGLIVATSLQHANSTFNNHIRVYPQPISSSGQVTIEWPSFNYPGGQIQIINMSGKVVHQQSVGPKDSKLTLKNGLLHSGIYLIKLLGKSNQFSGKLVVN
jgi:endonuclease I